MDSRADEAIDTVERLSDFSVDIHSQVFFSSSIFSILFESGFFVHRDFFFFRRDRDNWVIKGFSLLFIVHFVCRFFGFSQSCLRLKLSFSSTGQRHSILVSVDDGKCFETRDDMRQVSRTLLGILLRRQESVGHNLFQSQKSFKE